MRSNPSAEQRAGIGELVLEQAEFATKRQLLRLLIDRVTPVKVEQTDEERGLDEALHGETAYLGAAS